MYVYGAISMLKVLFLLSDYRDELYKEFVAALQGGLLSGKDFSAITNAIKEVFENVDRKLLNW